MNKSNSIEWVGWCGAVAILFAYALNSFGVIDSGSLIYQILNLSGAVGIITISLVKDAKQPAALNIVWAFIALIAIIQITLS